MPGMRWAKLIGLAVAGEVALIASAVLFMLVYSAAIHPGEQAAFYNAQARVLLPYVAVTVSLPLFYWLARSAGGWTNALAFWATHEALDIAIALSADGRNGFTILWLLSQALKLLGCWLGTGNLKH